MTTEITHITISIPKNSINKEEDSISLSIEEAKELYGNLGKLFGPPPLPYTGIRNFEHHPYQFYPQTKTPPPTTHWAVTCHTEDRDPQTCHSNR